MSSVSSSTDSKQTLLAQARRDWTHDQTVKSFSTGEKAQSVPSDAVLIAFDPELAQAIADLASSSSSSGGMPMMGGGGAPAGGTPPSSSSSSASSSSGYSASGASTSSSEPQQVNMQV